MNRDIGDNQGRIGMASVNASRAALGMKPLPDPDAQLWQRSGGARVENGVGFHCNEDEPSDELLTTVDAEGERCVRWVRYFFAGLLFAGLALSAYFK